MPGEGQDECSSGGLGGQMELAEGNTLLHGAGCNPGFNPLSEGNPMGCVLETLSPLLCACSSLLDLCFSAFRDLHSVGNNLIRAASSKR